MTPGMKDTLDYLKAFYKEHGYMPSHEQIMVGVGQKSKSGVNRLLHGLQDRGLITIQANRARAITINGHCDKCGRSDAIAKREPDQEQDPSSVGRLTSMPNHGGG